jgi:pantetheine-phosphate adenylyltransferase
LAAPSSNIIAIYPGSFDPLTNGHLDVIARGSRLVQRLIVAVLRNQSKQPFFPVEERVEMLQEAVQSYANVEVDAFEGLLVDYADTRGANLILRGIRAVSDYEMELQMALMNRKLNPSIETVFLMASGEASFISSHLVKEVVSLGGDVSQLVPAAVAARLSKRIAAQRG